MLYRSILAENISVIASGMRTERRVSYVAEREKIWDAERASKKIDTRTAEQIIADTFAKHGIQIAGETDGHTESICEDRA